MFYWRTGNYENLNHLFWKEPNRNSQMEKYNNWNYSLDPEEDRKRKKLKTEKGKRTSTLIEPQKRRERWG